MPPKQFAAIYLFLIRAMNSNSEYLPLNFCGKLFLFIIYDHMT